LPSAICSRSPGAFRCPGPETTEPPEATGGSGKGIALPSNLHDKALVEAARGNHASAPASVVGEPVHPDLEAILATTGRTVEQAVEDHARSRERLTPEVLARFAPPGMSTFHGVSYTDPIDEHAEGHVPPIGGDTPPNVDMHRPDCERAYWRSRWFAGKTTGQVYRFKVTTCGRKTCPACRKRLVAAEAETLVERFDGLPMYRVLVAEDDWQAVRKRITRRDTDTDHPRYVGVPAPGGRVEVFSPVPAVLLDEVPVEVPVEDRLAVARDVFRAQPVDGRHIRSSSTRTGEAGNPAGSWFAEARKPREPLEYLGSDDSRIGTPEVVRMAAEDGIAAELVGTDGALLHARPLDPRMQRLMRRCGFAEPRGEIVDVVYGDHGEVVGFEVRHRGTARSVPLRDDWRDDPTLWHKGRLPEEPPLPLEGVAA